MAWPNDRLLTYLAGITPVRANDLNAIQDAIIAGQRHGEKTLVLHPHKWVSQGASSGSLAVAPPGFLTSGAGSATMGIPLHAGDRIKSVRFMRFGDGAVDVSAYGVFKLNAGNTAEVDLTGGGVINNVAAAWTETTINVTDTILAADESCRLIVSYNAAALRLGRVSVLYDHPV